MRISHISAMLVAAWCVIACAKKENSPDNAVADNPQTDTATQAEMKPVKIDARNIGPEKSQEQIQIEEAIDKLERNKELPVVGFWVGPFGNNKINIAIAAAEDGKALGYTVCAGNFRPITGDVKSVGDSLYTFNMNEPGTDKYDGHFEFIIYTKQKTMEGSWSPFKKGAASSKKFRLTKTTFAYNTDQGFYPDASSRFLEESDVNNLTKDELELMRNEIYARHGYSFKDKAMRAYFDTTSWYVPMAIDIRENLTDIEVQNIDLIYLYEQYQAENYDSYGR